MSRYFMFRGLLSLVVASSTFTMALPPQPPSELWYNRTTALQPQINSRHVVNDGYMEAIGQHPWISQNTITYTNRGTMYGALGWRFETVTPPFGVSSPADVFFNSTSGRIEAADSGGFAIIIIGEDGQGTGGGVQTSSTSLIKVNANNITNRGLLNVGANGFIQVHGRNVDLTSGKLVVGDIDD
ncbi:MAG: hypothetical protein ACXW32_05835, partial [Limisphaerales bacterium]